MMPDREWSHGLHVRTPKITHVLRDSQGAPPPILPLLALLPLQDDVLRERPAPLLPDAQTAGLIMRMRHKNKHVVPTRGCDL